MASYTGLSVIVIEDNEDVRELIIDRLKESEMFKSIVYSVDGTDAMSKLKNQKFDIIFLDIDLPKANGVKVVDFISSNQNNSVSSVVVVSGSLNENDLKNLAILKVKNFLIKPFDADNLIKICMRILKNK